MLKQFAMFEGSHSLIKYALEWIAKTDTCSKEETESRLKQISGTSRC